MPFVSMRDLQRNAAQIIDESGKTGRPAIVTRNSKPVGLLFAVNEDEFEDYLLSQLPSLDDDITAAYEDIDQGLTVKASEVIAAIRAGR